MGDASDCCRPVVSTPARAIDCAKGKQSANVLAASGLETCGSHKSIAGEQLRVSSQEPALTVASSAAQKVDGRRLRSERTRLAIIEAYLELLRRNPRMPTAAQLATQAGCLVRSIFERFPDLDALHLATADYAIVQGQAESVARPCRR